MFRKFCLKPGLVAATAIASFALPAAAQAAPDLRVAIELISPQPASPNGQVDVRTRITNAGRPGVSLNLRTANNKAQHVIRWFYVERGKREKFVLAKSMMGDLGAFSNKWTNARVRIPKSAKPGSHQICAVVDPANGIREANEGNNRACAKIRIKGGAGGIARAPRIKPGIKPGIRPGIAGRKPAIKPGVLAKQCPNPAIVELQIGIIRKTSRFAGEIQLKAVAKNKGNADYVTRPNQQSVQFYHGRKLLKNAPFGNLAKGQVKILTARLPWNATSEFQDTLSARIVYDPDIRMDGNPRNDDCNMRDNSQSVQPAQVNQLFGR